MGYFLICYFLWVLQQGLHGFLNTLHIVGKNTLI